MRNLEALLSLGLVCLAGACAQYRTTIPDRQRDPSAAAQEVTLSLEEELPGLAAESFPQAAEDPVAVIGTLVPPTIGGGESYSFEWRDAYLAHALHQLAETAQVSIYLDPTLDRPIDASFRDTTLDSALQALLARNGLCLREEPVGIYWIEICDGSEQESRGFLVQSIDATDVEARLKTLLGDQARIVVDASQNLVVVRGRRSEVELAASYIEQADRLKRQVLVDVRILEVTLGERFELGLAGEVSGTTDGDLVDLMTALSTPGKAIELTFQNGNVEATLNALERYAGVNLISSPRVVAVTGTEATIDVVREVPYVNVTSTTSGTTGGIGTQTVEEVQFKEAGVKLKVTPTVQEGGVIEIKIDQELSEVADVFKEIPVIDRRHLTSEFQVADRGTIVLGGLMQRRTNEIDTGVPLLMDLPLIGRLFRSDVDHEDRRELLIFLTPRIVDPRSATPLSHALKDAWTERVRSAGMGPKPGVVRE